MQSRRGSCSGTATGRTNEIGLVVWRRCCNKREGSLHVRDVKLLLFRLAALLLAVTMLAAACGGDDDDEVAGDTGDDGAQTDLGSIDLGLSTGSVFAYGYFIAEELGFYD